MRAEKARSDRRLARAHRVGLPKTDVAAHGVPPTLSSFVGREREVEAVCALLVREDVRLVTLAGPGGIGKTRLALRSAETCAAAFPDGVWFVDLAPVRDASLVAPTILRVFGGVPSPERSSEEQLIAWNQDRTLLLVLDNLEHLPDASPLVMNLVAACPGITVLVTSRVRLRLSGEHVYRVPPLLVSTGRYPSEGPAEAERLFIERARQAGAPLIGTASCHDTIAEICRTLDGLPLAIELAAAWSPVLAPDLLLDRLRDRFALLVHGPRDAPARHQTLASAISWGEELLDPETRSVLYRVSVFDGGFTLEAAESVAGDRPEVLNRIATLVDASMLIAEQTHDAVLRYRLLETIRHHALAGLAASGEEDQVRRRHAAYHANCADGLWESIPPAMFEHRLAALHMEHANIRAAFTWAREHHPGIAMRLASGLGEYCARFGYVIEGRAWLDWCLQVSEGRHGTLRVRILLASAWLAVQQVDLDSAERLAREAVSECRRSDDGDMLAPALIYLTAVLLAQGALGAARDANDEALPRCEMLGDHLLVAISILNDGRIAAAMGDLERGESRLTEALERHTQLGSTFGVAVAKTFLGKVASARGDGRRAAMCYHDALMRYRSAGDWVNVSRVLEGLAEIPHTGTVEHGIRLLSAAASMRRRLGHPVDREDVAEHEQALARARKLLEPSEFLRTWEAGSLLSWEQAVSEGMQLANHLASLDRPAGTPGSAFGLTARELEVLRLLVEGRTDAEIATVLFISQRTAATHARHIYDKLGVSSRAAAAALAVRQGLA